MTTTAPSARPVGELLRGWRERRRLSQLDLSIQAQVSTRHLSFVETGRARPTPEMILRLTDHLQVPLRERNQLLLAGGYAPAYPQHGFDAPELARIADALRSVLGGHPYPALVMDRWWDMLDANDATLALTTGCAAHLLEPPVNVLRLSLHPDGLAPRIVNLGQWRGHLMTQLRQRIERTDDHRLRALEEELLGYPGGTLERAPAAGVVLPLRLRTDVGVASYFSVAAAVETATDVTVEELVLETFYPAP